MAHSSDPLIRIGHLDGEHITSWKALVPAQWKNPSQPRLVMLSYKPEADIRPKSRLVFKDKNKPVFASSWKDNAFITIYDPKQKNKERIRQSFNYMGASNYPEPLSPGFLCCFSSFSIPKSTPKKKVAHMLGQRLDVKPDVDNMVKFYMDALQGLVIPDDHRISTMFVDQFFGQHPGVMILYCPNVDKQSVNLGFTLLKRFRSYACPDLFRQPVEGAAQA